MNLIVSLSNNIERCGILETMNDRCIAPALVICNINGINVRFMNYDHGRICIQSESELSERLIVDLHVFDFQSYGYEDYMFEDSSIDTYEKNKFYYSYFIVLGTVTKGNEQKLNNQIKVIHRIMNQEISTSDLIKNCEYKDAEIYPIEKEREFCTLYEDQEKMFYDFDAIQYQEEFANIVSGVEMVFSIRTYRQYKIFLEIPFDEMCREYLEKRGVSQHGIFLKKFTRVYIGNEYCPELFPNRDLLMELIHRAIEQNLQVTIVFPYIGDNELDRFLSILKMLDHLRTENGMDSNIEVVLNDWGMIQYINDNKMSVTPILGRLLNKRKKDPRYRWSMGYQKYRDLLRTNLFNDPRMLRFVNDLGVNRIEYESHGIGNLVNNQHSSLHFPFYQMTTARFCIMNADCKNKSMFIQELVEGCSHYCEVFCNVYPKHLQMVGRGNTVYGFEQSIFTKPEILRDYIESGIDRLIYSV